MLNQPAGQSGKARRDARKRRERNETKRSERSARRRNETGARSSRRRSASEMREKRSELRKKQETRFVLYIYTHVSTALRESIFYRDMMLVCNVIT